jgi:ParB family chromosome partitioning protein
MSRKDALRRNNSSVDDIFDETSETMLEGETIVLIPKHTLYSNPQVRQEFKQEAIDELRINIENTEQRTPCRVGPMDNRGHLIQEGERRWRAIMGSDKITHVKCIIGEGDLITQVSENILREDLNPIEEGNAYALIKTTYDFTHNKEVAEALGISEAKVSAAIKAAQAPELIKTAYFKEKIGDVDTINSLRIAYDINPDETSLFLTESTSVSRKEAQELTKRLKAEKKGKSQSTKKAETTQNEISTEEAVSKDTTQEKAENPSVETVVKTETDRESTPSPSKAKHNSDTKNTQINKGIRIRLDDQFGIIDLSGQSEDGEIVVILDSTPGKMTVPASDVVIVGYHVE